MNYYLIYCQAFSGSRVECNFSSFHGHDDLFDCSYVIAEAFPLNQLRRKNRSYWHFHRRLCGSINCSFSSLPGLIAICMRKSISGSILEAAWEKAEAGSPWTATNSFQVQAKHKRDYLFTFASNRAAINKFLAFEIADLTARRQRLACSRVQACCGAFHFIEKNENRAKNNTTTTTIKKRQKGGAPEPFNLIMDMHTPGRVSINVVNFQIWAFTHRKLRLASGFCVWLYHLAECAINRNEKQSETEQSQTMITTRERERTTGR